jgi:ribA/ribD-fused uncharacterized protein
MASVRKRTAEDAGLTTATQDMKTRDASKGQGDGYDAPISVGGKSLTHFKLFGRRAQTNQTRGPFVFFKELAALSMWAPAPIHVDGFGDVPTGEHDFMWQKLRCAGLSDAEIHAIMLANPTPKAIKNATQKKNLPMTREQLARWDNGASQKAMFEANLRKYTQSKEHKKLAEVLLGTGDAVLVENAGWDRKWGIGKPVKGTKAYTTYDGRNLLGGILGRVRSVLRADAVVAAKKEEEGNK